MKLTKHIMAAVLVALPASAFADPFSGSEGGSFSESSAGGAFAGGAFSHSATSGAVSGGNGFVENRAGQLSSLDMDMEIDANGFTFETTSFTTGLAEQSTWGNGNGSAEFSGESFGAGVGAGSGFASEWNTDYEADIELGGGGFPGLGLGHGGFDDGTPGNSNGPWSD